jgi:hypothetical protein
MASATGEERRGVSGYIERMLERLPRFLDKHLQTCRCAQCCWHVRGGIRAALKQLLTLLRAEGLIAPALAALINPVDESKQLRYFSFVVAISPGDLFSDGGCVDRIGRTTAGSLKRAVVA